MKNQNQNDGKPSVQFATRFLVASLIMIMTKVAQADATTPPPPHPPGHGFMLGVCVGQTLAQQGTVLTLPQKGQTPTPPDAATKAAIDTAVQACKASLPAPPDMPSSNSN